MASNKFTIFNNEIELWSTDFGWFTIEGRLGGTGANLFFYIIKVRRKGW